MQSKVSMVVPCYNKVNYIGAFFKSVYGQKWDDIQLILVNDGSTDGTREIIGQWEPRFRERGYELIIVDQENQGVAGAVKVGMLLATGEYFCTVDCDDELDPEYVSKMADFLEKNPGYEWVACDMAPNGNVEEMIKRKNTGSISYADTYPFWGIGAKMNVYVYMVKMAYIRRCKVVENLCTHIRCPQEAQYLYPLIMGGGQLKILPDKLYKNIKRPGSLSEKHGHMGVREERHRYYLGAVETIKPLDCKDEQKRTLIFLEKFASLIAQFVWLPIADSSSREAGAIESASELSVLLDTCFSPPPAITPAQLTGVKARLLAAAVVKNVLGEDSPRFHKTGKLYACGALGEIGRRFLDAIIDTPLEPDTLWDNGAKPESTLCGFAVTKPDYDILMPEDTVLIFPKLARAVEEISSECARRGIVRFVNCFDMMDILSECYFPQFYGQCEFTLIKNKGTAK